MKRAAFGLANLLQATSRCSHSTSAASRLLLRNRVPVSISCLSFSAEVRSETTKDPVAYSLKNESKRLTSAEFLKKVGESLGEAASSKNFQVPRAAVDALAVEYDALLEEADTFKDKYMRTLAEVENVRRRGQKQVEEAKVFAIQGFCKDLLEVADILDLAVGAVKKEEAEKNDALKNLFEGLEMTRTVLENTFTKHGLKKISPEGEKFDPGMHEAVFEVPKEQAKVESGHVAEVVKIGYALLNRPIRAAKVGVAQ